MYYMAMIVFYIWWIAAYIRALLGAPVIWKAYILLDFPWLFLYVASLSTLSSGGIVRPWGFGPRDLRRMLRTWHIMATFFIVIVHALIPFVFVISTIMMSPALIIASVRWFLSLIGIGCLWESPHGITYAQFMSLAPWAFIGGLSTIIAPVLHACCGIDPPQPPVRTDPLQLWTRVAPLVASYRANRNSGISDSMIQLLPSIARYVEGGAHWTSPQQQIRYVNNDDDDGDDADAHYNADQHDIELSIKPIVPLPVTDETVANSLTAATCASTDTTYGVATIAQIPSSARQPSSISSVPSSPKQNDGRNRSGGSVTMIIDDAVAYATRWTGDIKRLVSQPWFDTLVNSADTRTVPILPVRPSSTAMARITRTSTLRRWCSSRRLILRYIEWLSKRFEHHQIGEWS